jgi:hypothetical protein
MKTYLYSISRKDLPSTHCSIQACHAAIEHAYLYGRPEDRHPSFIHLITKNKMTLEKLRAALHDQGIQTAEFHEPYMDWGLTAISCLLTEEQRHHLKHLQLWSAS